MARCLLQPNRYRHDLVTCLKVRLSAPPRVTRAPRHSRASRACALASSAPPRLSRPTAISMGSCAPSGTPAPGHFYSPARGSGLGLELSLSWGACPYLLQFLAWVGGDPGGLRPLRPRWATTSGPGPGQQSPLRPGEAGPATAGVAAFSFTPASRGTAPEGSGGVEPLLLPLLALRHI
ncbi:hypothetical protein NDU88_006864 [Pleurodeles waltl]|uniref:Uncharacterized protein n=1 Tax=Pleurodeles waltl TaxID=8319 RepID=A0AAV7X2R4_PLEWA|nr:hypothetical protein NDU88_006864 [Pleurodeles waltl]